MSHQDTEEATREKVMAQVKFETSIYKVQQKFGEEMMKEVLDSAKPGAVGVKGLAGTPELEELKAKIQMMDGGDHSEPAQAAAQAAQAAPTPEIRSKAAARPPQDPAPDSGDSGDSFPTALVVSIAAAMAVLGGFWILKRRRE